MSGLSVLLAHLSSGQKGDVEDPRVVDFRSSGQPSELRELLDVLAHFPFAALNSTSLTLSARTLGRVPSLEDLSGFGVAGAFILAAGTGRRSLVVGWKEGDSNCAVFEYDDETGAYTLLGRGLTSGVGEYLNRRLNEDDDFWGSDPEEAEQGLLEAAGESPALRQLFFDHIDVEDEELFFR